MIKNQGITQSVSNPQATVEAPIGLPQTGHSQRKSSPTPKGGRYYKMTGNEIAQALFQSSPTPKGGRYFLNPRIQEKE